MQTALDVRGKQEKVQMKEMALALAAQQEIESQIEAVDLEVQGSNQQMNQQKHQGAFTIDQFRFLDHFKQKKRLERGRFVAQHKEAVVQTETKRLALVEASKKRKTLEILRDRELTRFQAKTAKWEREFVDEVASNQFSQKQR